MNTLMKRLTLDGILTAAHLKKEPEESSSASSTVAPSTPSPSKPGFFDWWTLPQDIRQRCFEAAEITRKKIGERDSTLNLRDDHDFIGNCGEAIFAIVTGRPVPDFVALAKAGDNNPEDFPGIDVKTTSRKPPKKIGLMVSPGKRFGSVYFSPSGSGVKWYVLVVYYDEERQGRVAGYASKKEIFSAPVDEDLPHPAHFIPEEQLHRHFPGEAP